MSVIVEVFIYKEFGLPSNEAFVTIDGVDNIYPLSVLEQTALSNLITSLQAEDVTNLGWLIQSTKNVTRIAVTLKESFIDETVTIFNKAVFLHNSSLHTEMNDFLTPILNTLIP